MKVATDIRINRRGTPWYPIFRLLRKYGLKIVEYKRDPKVTYFAFDNCDNAKIDNKVLFMGSVGKAKKVDFNRVTHPVFISDFFGQICKTGYKNVSNGTTIPIVGGLPADDSPAILKPKKLPDTIHLMACAKWWKRPFKRRGQIEKFFNKYFIKKYPNSYLHVLGCLKEQKIGRIIRHAKSFHNEKVVKAFKNSTMHITLSPFDTGPMTINESLHYRIPFICTNNCGAKEFVDRVDGLCGSIVKVDPDITSANIYNINSPVKPSFYKKQVDYDLVLDACSNIIDNYEEYTSWSWKPEWTYEEVAQKWIRILK